MDFRNFDHVALDTCSNGINVFGVSGEQVDHWVFVFSEGHQISQLRHYVVVTHPLTFEVSQDGRFHNVYGISLITQRSTIEEVAVEVCFQALLQTFDVFVVRFHLTFQRNAVWSWESYAQGVDELCNDAFNVQLDYFSLSRLVAFNVIVLQHVLVGFHGLTQLVHQVARVQDVLTDKLTEEFSEPVLVQHHSFGEEQVAGYDRGCKLNVVTVIHSLR